MKFIQSSALFLCLATFACGGNGEPVPFEFNWGPASNSLYTAPTYEGSSTPTKSQVATFVQQLCQKLIQCGVPSYLEQKCSEEMMDFLIFNIPDFSSFSTCVLQTSCEALLSGNKGFETTFEKCADIDTDSFTCEGDYLNYCNNNGSCASTSCKDVCEKMGKSTGSCKLFSDSYSCDCD